MEANKSITLSEHQREFNFRSRNRESHIYAYKYDVGQGTGLNTLYGLRDQVTQSDIKNKWQIAGPWAWEI